MLALALAELCCRHHCLVADTDPTHLPLYLCITNIAETNQQDASIFSTCCKRKVAWSLRQGWHVLCTGLSLRMAVCCSNLTLAPCARQLSQCTTSPLFMAKNATFLMTGSTLGDSQDTSICSNSSYLHQACDQLLQNTCCNMHACILHKLSQLACMKIIS